MALASIISVLLVAVITEIKCEATFRYHHTDGTVATQFGDLLKPPPPPPSLSKIQPVPFHGGAAGRTHRQNVDLGYHYVPPPPPPPPPIPPSSNDFKFPAPFYKQYNFNFLPQPFTTTPSPSLFQKVSGWLFPSQQTSDSGITAYSSNVSPVKKDCNPCNLVPWIPVIRYDLGAKNIQPTYGAPSPTAYANAIQYRPKPFDTNSNEKLPSVANGKPFEIYGPPKPNYLENSFNGVSSTYGPPSATVSANYVTQSQNHGQSQPLSYGNLNPTYGPPSPTHTIAFASEKPPTSTYSVQSSSSYALQSSSIGNSNLNKPISSFGEYSSSYPQSSSSYGIPSSTYGPPSASYGAPLKTYENNGPTNTPYQSQSSSYLPSLLNNDLPQQNTAELTDSLEPSLNLQLPEVSPPKGFKNSYGEPINNPSAFGILYPASATAAESNKIKTEVLPNEKLKNLTPNVSLALANPAPFSLNRGRNIHTLQPVALPNLSVSPLPPIFNARPFRPMKTSEYLSNNIQGINHMQQSSNVKISQSVPIAEFTHSIEYPTSIIQSPIIDIDSSKSQNQSKAFRNIPNSYIVDEYRDISSQASEDHISATNTNPDASFESTGADFGNDLDNGNPIFFKHKSSLPSNHKSSFADLRGVKDGDVDKYRTESNLQNIDSPLLYLKPSAPHKEFDNFVLALPTPNTSKDYEIYDENPPTTESSQYSTPPSAWDESRTDYSEDILPPPFPQGISNKPKIVQIIIPYTTSQQEGNKNIFYDNESPEWLKSTEEDYQARKVPTNTEVNYNGNTVTDAYSTVTTTTEPQTQTYTEHYDDRFNTPAIMNDLYDIKEPPFDIIKLQNHIDDWTEQQFSKRIKNSQKSRGSEKYAKQIPEDFFTTENPIVNYVTPTSTYNYEFYDHEGSSSVYHAITELKNKTIAKPRKEYSNIDRGKNKKTKHAGKIRESNEEQKPYIYTAASSFRSTSTTQAPWGKVLTSISPLTKEKVYVVTSKPWSDKQNFTKDWYNVESFESKKTKFDNDVSASDNLPFKSPRFSNRPSSEEDKDPVDPNSSYGFSKNWHHGINQFEPKSAESHSTFLPEGSHEKIKTNTEELTTVTTIVEPRKENSKAR